MATTDGFGSQKARRLSSLDADRAELYGGPNVVMPPKYLMASTRDRDLVSDIEMDKNHSDEEAISSEEESSAVTTPLTIPPMAVSDDFALAFDIDGVLIRGGQAIPEAIEAMKYINGENPYGVKV
jgi:hypothetical protein